MLPIPLVFCAILAGCSPSYPCGDHALEEYCGTEGRPCPTEEEMRTEEIILGWKNECLGWWSDDQPDQSYDGEYGCVVVLWDTGCREFWSEASREGHEGESGLHWEFDSRGDLAWFQAWPCTDSTDGEATAEYGERACARSW